MKIVKTNEILKRDDKFYEVLISDDNLFVVGESKFSEEEGCWVTSYESPEVYANQSEINTLAELNFKKYALICPFESVPVYIKDVCPKCGGHVLDIVIATNPPIPQKRCFNCGEVFKTDEI